MDEKASGRRVFATGWIFTMGILIMVLGAIHCATAPFVMQRAWVSLLPPEGARVFLFMYLATGFATLFAGWFVTLGARGLRLGQAMAWSLTWRVSLFLLLLGIGGAAFMFENPFAHLTLLFSILLVIPVFWYRPMFKPKIGEM
jgi:hypothetical protein